LRTRPLSTKPLTMHTAEAAVVRQLWLGNLAVFLVLSAGAFVVAPWRSAVSVVVGGAIALANFRLLQASIVRALTPPLASKRAVLGRSLAKYYLRFMATAVLIILLVRQGVVEPLGLLVGLSVVVLSIMAWGVAQARKLYKEEAF